MLNLVLSHTWIHFITKAGSNNRIWMLNCLSNNKCKFYGYHPSQIYISIFFWTFCAAKAHFCGTPSSHIVKDMYDHKMENIVCVRPFQQHSFHIRSGKKTHPFEMKPVWSETRIRTSDGFTNLTLTGGLTGADSYSSLSPLADQYQESGHYAPLKALREQSICYYFSSAGCI